MFCKGVLHTTEVTTTPPPSQRYHATLPPLPSVFYTTTTSFLVFSLVTYIAASKFRNKNFLSLLFPYSHFRLNKVYHPYLPSYRSSWLNFVIIDLKLRLKNKVFTCQHISFCLSLNHPQYHLLHTQCSIFMSHSPMYHLLDYHQHCHSQ